MLESTGKFKVHDIVYNNGEFALARGYWEGGPKLSLACRWHEKEGIGYPQTFGKAQWMLLPPKSVEIVSTIEPSDSKKIVLTFA